MSTSLSCGCGFELHFPDPNEELIGQWREHFSACTKARPPTVRPALDHVTSLDLLRTSPLPMLTKPPKRHESCVLCTTPRPPTSKNSMLFLGFHLCDPCMDRFTCDAHKSKGIPGRATQHARDTMFTCSFCAEAWAPLKEVLLVAGNRRNELDLP